MRLNEKNCLLCGELHGANLRISGYEICTSCEARLLAGRMPIHAALLRLRRLSVKTCLADRG